MVPRSSPSTTAAALLLLLISAAAATSGGAIRLSLHRSPPPLPAFREAPSFRNSDRFCNATSSSSSSSSSSSTVHVAMTLDANYLRGTIAAVFSILQHASCPENISFHFLSSDSDPDSDSDSGDDNHRQFRRRRHRRRHLQSSIRSTFPYLTFSVHRFNAARVRGKISRSIRQALDQPLNYARIHLAEILPAEVEKVIYFDSDLVVVDDVAGLWRSEMRGRVVAAPEYCHANFTHYFTEGFWSDPTLSGVFERRRPCYFNTGVMVVDVAAWRRGRYTEKIEAWMELQKRRRIYHLGSLPPFLLVFAGEISAIDHRWNQHGLGGDNFQGKCRGLHPGPVSLLHWSGKGKPWLRLDSRRPCAVDHLWAPYDLYRSSRHSLEE